MVARWARLPAVAIVLAIAACTGPETGDDLDPTPTSTATVPPTATTAAVAASPTVAATPTTEPTPTTAASPTAVEASPTIEASPSPAAIEDLRIELPQLAELPGQGYTITEEGTRSAQDLANAYSDAAAHLRRLEEWGFQRHVFRAFARNQSGDQDPLPPLILATINEYGSPEQAEQALQWLRSLTTSQGGVEAEAPRVGDSAVALTLPTAAGVPTASVYVRRGPHVYVYFAEGGDPLAAVQGIAQKVFRRE